MRSKAYYLQTGYTLAEKWTPYARYDYAATDDRLNNDPSFYQKIWVAGVGYKIGNNFNLRLEDHINRGYALPVASGEVAAGTGRKNWNLFAASINFIF